MGGVGKATRNLHCLVKDSQWDDYPDLMNVSHFSSKPFHITCVTEKTISSKA